MKAALSYLVGCVVTIAVTLAAVSRGWSLGITALAAVLFGITAGLMVAVLAGEDQ